MEHPKKGLLELRKHVVAVWEAAVAAGQLIDGATKDQDILLIYGALRTKREEIGSVLADWARLQQNLHSAAQLKASESDDSGDIDVFEGVDFTVPDPGSEEDFGPLGGGCCDGGIPPD